MNSNTILTLSDELLERYRSSIPRKAFERFVEDITTGPAATAAPKFDASLLCRASFPAELEDDGGRCIVEVTVYRLNAVAVHTFLLDGPEPLLRHLGLSEADTYITKHDIDDIAAGIRWHYERGTNALADDDTLTQARADIEAARQQAAEAGLPFSERLVEGPEDEINPYTYDGSMTVADYEAAQRARDAHAALVEVVADHYPNATEEAVERVAEAASSMKLSPEAVQRILDAFDNIIEAINRMIEWAAQAIRTLADFFGETLDNFILRRAPPKWRHYALHAKRARVRKKYRNRIRRAFFAALASEGGGSS